MKVAVSFVVKEPSSAYSGNTFVFMVIFLNNFEYREILINIKKMQEKRPLRYHKRKCTLFYTVVSDL